MNTDKDRIIVEMPCGFLHCHLLFLRSVLNAYAHYACVCIYIRANQLRLIVHDATLVRLCADYMYLQEKKKLTHTDQGTIDLLPLPENGQVDGAKGATSYCATPSCYAATSSSCSCCPSYN